MCSRSEPGCGRRPARIGWRPLATAGTAAPSRAAAAPTRTARSTCHPLTPSAGDGRSAGVRWDSRKAARPIPAPTPTGTAATVRMATSTMKTRNTCREEAPAARRSPVSRRRSLAASATLLAVAPAPTTRLSTVTSTSRGCTSPSGEPLPASGLAVVTALPSALVTSAATWETSLPGVTWSATMAVRKPSGNWSSIACSVMKTPLRPKPPSPPPLLKPTMVNVSGPVPVVSWILSPMPSGVRCSATARVAARPSSSTTSEELSAVGTRPAPSESGRNATLSPLSARMLTVVPLILALLSRATTRFS